MLLEKCPNCGSKIVSAYKTSYYLRCKRDYNCWHQHCDEATAELYTDYTAQEERLLGRMLEKLDDDDCDYFHDDDYSDPDLDKLS